ncbi:MAG: fumarylacetoacetate hydrolase family protein [Parvularcula sp.]|jgi:acylpyruvate hydrolase|nr:fumarylacetoacetate hydrolase family protein [Parvularcula sp.]
MRLAAVEGNGSPRAVLVSDDGQTFRWADECAGWGKERSLTVIDVLNDPGLQADLRDGCSQAELHELNCSLLLPPVMPRRIVGIGLNYQSHAQEVGREPGSEPVVFLKDIASLNRPYGSITAPDASPTLDYEAELAVIIAGAASGEDSAQAVPGVAGYAVANDLTLRALAKPPTLTVAKGLPGSCPLGPWITTADAVKSPDGLIVRSSVNGELRQSAHVSEMIFKIPEILLYLSRFFRLETGDVVLTGSPSGSGASFDPPRWLRRGDVVRAEISELGSIETRVM